MRTITAIFEIQEDSNLAGVYYKADGEKIEWEQLSRLEQIRMLNAWAGHHELFSRFLKEE